MTKDYTIFINKRPIQVDLLTLMCHCSGEFSGLQPKDEYSIFLRDFRLPVGTIEPYLRTYLSYTSEEEYPRVSIDDISNSSVLKYMRFSILLTSWYGTYFNNVVTTKRNIPISQLVAAGVNYPQLKLSKEYLSLQPLTQFYKRLTIDLDMDRYIPLYEKDYVTVTDINNTLKGLESNVTYEDIKDDIEKHCILNPYEGNYIWGSKPLYNWLLNVDYIDLKVIDITKKISLL